MTGGRDRPRKRGELVRTIWKAALALVALVVAAGPAAAPDRLKMAIGQRGFWDTSVPELGQRAGIFKKHGLELEILWTQGAGESQQAALSESVDLGLAGTLSAFGAYSKGAPIRIVSAEATGAADYWYVRADSPIHSMKEAAGTTVAYSTNGASTHIFVLALIKAAGITAEPVATGGPTPTFTQVMSGQIDVGWSSPPFGLEQLAQNKIRIVARGSDILAGREQTIRAYVTTAPILQAKRAALARFLAAYRETVDWMYAGEEALEAYAAFVGIPLDRARRVRDEFFPKRLLLPEPISGVPSLLEDAVTFKYLAKPLDKEQLAELIQVPKP